MAARTTYSNQSENSAKKKKKNRETSKMSQINDLVFDQKKTRNKGEIRVARRKPANRTTTELALTPQETKTARPENKTRKETTRKHPYNS